MLSVPAIKAVRSHFPDAEVTLLVRPWVAGLFRSASFIDNVWSKPKAKGIGEWIRTAREIRRKRFDLAVLLPNSFEAALTVWAGGIPERVGYRTDGRSLLLTRSVRPSPARQHQCSYYLRLVAEAFGPSAEPELRIKPRRTRRPTPGGCWNSRASRRPGVFWSSTLVLPSGGAKRWREDRFAEVADRLADELDLSVAIIGSESERTIGERVRDRMKSGAALLSGLTSLETLVGILAEASLMVTNDSGPMHIGAALGTPTVAVFGSTNAEVTSPVGPNTSGRAARRRLQPLHAPRVSHRSSVHGRGHGVRGLFVGDGPGRPDPGMSGTDHSASAIFLDRDGTVSEEVGYMYDVSLYRVFPGQGGDPADQQSGMKVLLVTNQSGIERGYFQESMVHRVHDRLREKIALSQARLDGVYFCPHHPETGCNCRKPRPGMLLRARDELGLDLGRSYMVGDRYLDVRTGKAAGAARCLC